jgi:hypothetical protein
MCYMINAETIRVENSPITVMNLTLGVRETKLLDDIIEKALAYPYEKEADETFEFELSMEQTMFLMSLAGRIGKSGMREYIESEVNKI